MANNKQDGKVGNLGDILKHAALLSLSQLLKSCNPENTVNYMETHAYRLFAPVAKKEDFVKRVNEQIAKYPAYQSYAEIELREINKNSNYWCSIKLATYGLINVNLYLAESDELTRNELVNQLHSESQEARIILKDMHGFTFLDSVAQAGPLLALVDPFVSGSKLREIWNTACDGIKALKEPNADGLIELFQYGKSKPNWPEPPLGFHGPIAAISKEEYHLAVYSTEAIAEKAISILTPLGWSSLNNYEHSTHLASVLENPQKAIHCIVKLLQENHQRATYGAIGEFLGVDPRNIGALLGDRTHTNSWIVSAETGQPTKYSIDELDINLPKTKSGDIIRNEEQLREFIQTHRGIKS